MNFLHIVICSAPSTILSQEGGIVCHGVKYAVVTSLPSQYTLRVEVEAKDGSGRWVGDFPKKCELIKWW